MKVKKVNVENKFISLKNISLDFSSAGMFFISGENGTGKSSLIKELVFGNYDVEFDNIEHEVAYKNNRGNLFAYMPQDIYPCNLTLKQYIGRENANVDEKSIIEYLEKFKVEYKSLNQMFSKMSGGEMEKCAIIATILKDVPYLFFDEPTNNLDDASVDLLRELFIELAKTKTLIIVSHDDRLKYEAAGEYTIHDNVVECTRINTVDKKNECDVRKTKVNIFKLLWNIGKGKMQGLALVYITLAMICTLVLNDYQYINNYSNEAMDNNGTICTYEADYEYGELNRQYCQKENLYVKEERQECLITYDDIPEIANMQGVQEIILCDVQYNYELSAKCVEETLLEEIQILSLPQEVTDEFSDLFVWSFDVSYLKEGNFPKDNMNQVVVSEGILNKYYSDIDVKEAIGKQILIEDKQYTIVGIHYYDICFVSYSDAGQNYGFYKYDPMTYGAFAERMIEYKINVIDTFAYNYTDTTLIKCDINEEKAILDYLVSNYPASNYSSYQFSTSWVDEHNANIDNKLFFWNIVYALIFGVILLFLSWFIVSSEKQKLQVYISHYLDRKRLEKIYILSKIFVNIIPFLFGLVYMLIGTTYGFSLFKFYLVVFVLICLPSTICCIMRSRRWQEL